MKTCTECGTEFDVADRGSGTAVTCSKKCGVQRRRMKDRELRRRKAAAAALGADVETNYVNPQGDSVQCDHCKQHVGFRVFVWVGAICHSLCLSCAALAKNNNVRKQKVVDRVQVEKAEREKSPLFELDQLVRARKPTGPRWLWR